MFYISVTLTNYRLFFLQLYNCFPFLIFFNFAIVRPFCNGRFEATDNIAVHIVLKKKRFRISRRTAYSTSFII